MRSLVLIIGIVSALSGCRNACQQICPLMAAYARDCGHEVSSAEVSACVAAQSGSASSDDRAVCREAGSRSVIREEWTCDDLSDYWARVSSDELGDTGDTGSVGE